VREEVGCIDRVFIRMRWSELEDQIKEFIDRSMFDDIGGDFVSLYNKPTR
jgi:hypothetical protein